MEYVFPLTVHQLIAYILHPLSESEQSIEVVTVELVQPVGL